MGIFRSQEIFSPHSIAPMSHCATLIELPNGELLAAWFSGAYETAPDQAIFTARLAPTQNTWTVPTVAVDTPGHANGQPVFLLDHAQTLWLYYVTLSGRDWTTAHVKRRRSQDLGHSWGEEEDLGLEEGYMLRSRPLYLPTAGKLGRWLLPAYDEKTWRSFMLISDDDGLTWRAGRPIITPSGNIHACVVPLPDGRLMAFLRTGGRGGVIWRTTSEDSGLSWSPPEPTVLPNPNSGLDLIRLSNGALILAFNNSHRRRTPLCVALSDDQGSTWPYLRVLEDGDAEFSYPTLISTCDGTIAAVYTWKRQCIRFVRFDEAWLRVGTPWVKPVD